MRYPITVQIDQSGILIGCPDIPEMHSAGSTLEEALREAVDGLESAVEIYFDARRPVPFPSPLQKGQHAVALSALTASKVLLHNEMLAQGVRKADLARRLNIAPPSVERIFRVSHKTRIETLEAALASLGKYLEVNAV
jgi:antitoxin HicB